MMRFRWTGWLLGLLLAAVLGTARAQQPDPRFFFGVDLSYANEMEDCGAVYRENGAPQDPFALFSAHGATLVRARLWHTPDWTEYSTLEDVTRTFARARAAGMDTLLDFHYSDNWADPGRQEIPAAWAELSDEALEPVVYDYTLTVLRALHAADLTPAFVQVGNEINGGLLKRSSAQHWPRDARLINAGIQAVRDFSAETGAAPRIILHIAQPENAAWWFTQAEAHGVADFDVIGLSYYPQWSVFSLSDLGAHVGFLRQRFGKDVMVVETAYGWTRDAVDETADNILNQGMRGYAFSPEGQRRFMTDLTQTLISSGALGVVYWEPAWVSTECATRWGQGSHWENATFFDFTRDNELLEGIDFLSAPYWFPEALADGVIEAAYGEPLVTDPAADGLDGLPGLDLTALYTRATNEALFLALEISGDVQAEGGNLLIYFDITHDLSGADRDVRRRPISVADPFSPEFRLDLSFREVWGTASETVTLNAWIDGDWEPVTFTGAVALTSGAPSVIELGIPRALLADPAALLADPAALLADPEVVYAAVVSTDAGRAHTAGDIMGTAFTPGDWDEPLILDAFFSLLPSE